MAQRKNGKNEKRKDLELIMLVSYNIRKYRIKYGLTQEQLQDITGLTISRYESGKKDMTLSTIGILSRHLNIQAYQLLK